MQLKSKILMPLLVSVGMMMALGLTSYFAMRSIQNDMESLAAIGINRMAVVNDSQDDLLDANIAVYRLFTWQGSYSPERISKEIASINDKINAATARLKDPAFLASASAEDRKSLASLAEMIAKYQRQIAQAIDMASSDVSTGAGMMQAADKRFLEIARVLGGLTASHRKASAEALAHSRVSSAQSVSLAVVLFVIAVAASLSIALVLASHIVKPLRSAMGAASSIAAGNLSNRIEEGESDETGQLLHALGDMQGNLRELISTIDDGIHQVSDASDRLAASSNQLAEGTAKQSDSIASVVATIQQMSTSISEVTQRISSTRDDARQTAAVSEKGLTMVGTAATEIQSIVATVNTASEDISALQSSSRQISEVANVIHEISDQTNLLALNAAIEAARAGDSGRGFAVVADEVRKLAEKTGQATTEIKTMLDSIHEKTEHSAKTMATVSEKVDSGVSMIQQLVDPLKEIYEGAQHSLNNLVELADAMNEQTTASNLAASHIEEIARHTEESSQVGMQAAEAARQMSSLSASLAGAVKRFKLEEGESGEGSA
ncbi:MAG TPA: methyl-accepting chemotaxis protein [Rhodocyclaceae bacterium]|nr:methyl-accepting chemotaxis protein [Rhodocyclaceae bacterium]